jgi:hypothetical protein
MTMMCCENCKIFYQRCFTIDTFICPYKRYSTAVALHKLHGKGNSLLLIRLLSQTDPIMSPAIAPIITALVLFSYLDHYDNLDTLIYLSRILRLRRVVL